MTATHATTTEYPSWANEHGEGVARYVAGVRVVTLVYTGKPMIEIVTDPSCDAIEADIVLTPAQTLELISVLTEALREASEHAGQVVARTEALLHDVARTLTTERLEPLLSEAFTGVSK